MRDQRVTKKWFEASARYNARLSLGLAIALLFACSVKTSIPVTNNANVPEAARLKTVAVYPFEGPHRDVFRAEVESLLVNANLDGNHYYTVVESTKVDSVLKAQRLGPVYDEATVVAVGRLVGARGVFMGFVTTDSVSDSHYNESRSKCVSTDKDGKCRQWRQVSISCTHRTANVAFTIRLVNVETGIQFYNRDVMGEAVSSACRGDKLDHRDIVRKQARQIAYAEIRKDLAPYSFDLSVELMDDTGDIESKQARRDLESGLAFARSGRMDRACEFWEQANAQAPHSVAILYNRGVCDEAAGDFESAYRFYLDADRMLRQPDPIINTALDRIQKRLEQKPIRPNP